MTPDDLRSLADALPEGVHWSDPITPEMLAEAIKRFCAAAPAAPQAEPKPTPASGNDLNVYKEMATNYRNDAQAEPKREPLSDEQITKGEYVLATKWGDGDPGDHWGVGFYDRLENGRHYIVDSSGKQIRGNGFRRVGRITAGVGRWLLSAAKSLEASPPGTINLWTMLTERAHGIGGSDAE